MRERKIAAIIRRIYTKNWRLQNNLKHNIGTLKKLKEKKRKAKNYNKINRVVWRKKRHVQ